MKTSFILCFLAARPKQKVWSISELFGSLRRLGRRAGVDTLSECAK
jgi:hypothetical protein